MHSHTHQCRLCGRASSNDNDDDYDISGILNDSEKSHGYCNNIMNNIFYVISFLALCHCCASAQWAVHRKKKRKKHFIWLLLTTACTRFCLRASLFPELKSKKGSNLVGTFNRTHNVGEHKIEVILYQVFALFYAYIKSASFRQLRNRNTFYQFYIWYAHPVYECRFSSLHTFYRANQLKWHVSWSGCVRLQA